MHDSPGTSQMRLREGDLQGCSESLWSLPSREICERYDRKQGKEKAHVVSMAYPSACRMENIVQRMLPMRKREHLDGASLGEEPC